MTGVSVLASEVGERWQRIDPLLPVPAALPPGPGCGAMLTFTGPDGQPQALGSCEHWQGEPDSLELTWGAARRFRLAVYVGGPDVAAALDGLLALWRVHLAGVPGADDADSAAIVTWPSRDIEGPGILLRRGFAPRSLVAARSLVARRALVAEGSMREVGQVHDAGAAPGIRIRRAAPGDIDAVVRLGLEEIRYDAHFGGVIERPGTAAALRLEIAEMLAAPPVWIWLAERDGSSIGLLAGEGPATTAWIAPMVGRGPLAYNMLTYVSPAERGSGAGTALVQRFHDDASAAGVAVALLHYEQTNPLAAPFWGQHGYRPLWTSWEARPACTAR